MTEQQALFSDLKDPPNLTQLTARRVPVVTPFNRDYSSEWNRLTHQPTQRTNRRERDSHFHESGNVISPSCQLISNYPALSKETKTAARFRYDLAQTKVQSASQPASQRLQKVVYEKRRRTVYRLCETKLGASFIPLSVCARNVRWKKRGKRTVAGWNVTARSDTECIFDARSIWPR